MTNDVRTLLLNLPPSGDPAERYVPPYFRPVPLPADLKAARDALLGSDQTRAVLCLRLDRLLAYAHNCPLAADLTRSDTRLTYDPLGPVPGDPAVEADGVWPFAAAAAGDFTDLFRPTKAAAEKRWYDAWRSGDPAPTRAVALALALAERVRELT